MNYIQGQNRNQIQMFSLEQLVSKDSFVRIIDEFIDSLDLSKFDFKNYNLNKQGRPPYYPSDLLKLYLFGYQSGIRSCRRLAKACKSNIEVIWLVKNIQPHYKTIANFRSENKAEFRKVFRLFVSILQDWGLIDCETIAIDSFKVRAQNSMQNNYNQVKINRHKKYIDAKVDEYLAELDKQDDKEKRKLIKQKLEKKKEQKLKYEQLEQQLKDKDEQQISTIDKDAKAVNFIGTAIKVGYNIQAASDSTHKLLVAAQTGDVNDTKALSKMTKQVQSNLRTKNFNVIADKGYHSGSQLEEVQKLGVTTFVSPKKSTSSKETAYKASAFKYDKEQDNYTCPQGAIMETNGKWSIKNSGKSSKSYLVKKYKTKSCMNCPVKANCTKRVRGRIVERSQYQDAIDSNNSNVNKNKEYYRQRQELIEHQFGTLKRHWHFDHVLLKGKEKVLAEVWITFTTYNLRRAMSIFGFSDFMSKIKAHFSSFFKNLRITLIIANQMRNKKLKYVKL